jgi:poly(3-hydroxybutyrate) depolymerase
MDAYLLHETSNVAILPWRVAAELAKLCFNMTLNPLAHTRFGRAVVATCELFERSTRRYDKPAFGLACSATIWMRVVLPHEGMLPN